MIQLGQKVKDKVSGFEGITTARVVYLNGCVQYCVTPKVDKEGKNVEGVYIDAGQLMVVSEGIDTKKSKKATGGVMNNTLQTNYRG